MYFDDNIKLTWYQKIDKLVIIFNSVSANNNNSNNKKKILYFYMHCFMIDY